MTFMTIRDDALWAKHIDEVEARQLILDLRENEVITLVVDGEPIRFAKMRDGADGRPTPGLRPADAKAKQVWGGLQARRGDLVEVCVVSAQPRPAELASLTALLDEWNSPEDAAAYDGL